MRPVHVLAVASLDALAAALDGLNPADDDLVLVHPEGRAVVAGGPEEIAATHEVFGEAVAVAASALPVSAGRSALRLTAVLLRGLGALPYRHHPFPLGLCGPAGVLRRVLAGLPDGTDDADRMAGALLAGNPDLALDSGGQVFRVLDGSGTDVVAVAGRFHAGNERPVVAIDPTPGGRPEAVGELAAGLEDPAGRDLAALLRYDGAVDPAPVKAVEAAPEILVMPFWTPEFCASRGAGGRGGRNLVVGPRRPGAGLGGVTPRPLAPARRPPGGGPDHPGLAPAARALARGGRHRSPRRLRHPLRAGPGAGGDPRGSSGPKGCPSTTMWPR